MSKIGFFSERVTDITLISEPMTGHGLLFIYLVNSKKDSMVRDCTLIM